MHAGPATAAGSLPRRRVKDAAQKQCTSMRTVCAARIAPRASRRRADGVRVGLRTARRIAARARVEQAADRGFHGAGHCLAEDDALQDRGRGGAPRDRRVAVLRRAHAALDQRGQRRVPRVQRHQRHQPARNARAKAFTRAPRVSRAAPEQRPARRCGGARGAGRRARSAGPCAAGRPRRPLLLATPASYAPRACAGSVSKKSTCLAAAAACVSSQDHIARSLRRKQRPRWLPA